MVTASTSISAICLAINVVPAPVESNIEANQRVCKGRGSVWYADYGPAESGLLRRGWPHQRNWRRGSEPNTPRSRIGTDNGFEDRGGHQTPITLRFGFTIYDLRFTRALSVY